MTETLRLRVASACREDASAEAVTQRAAMLDASETRLKELRDSRVGKEIDLPIPEPEEGAAPVEPEQVTVFSKLDTQVRVRSQCRFVLPFILFIPDLLRIGAYIFEMTMRPNLHAGTLPRGPEHRADLRDARATGGRDEAGLRHHGLHARPRDEEPR